MFECNVIIESGETGYSAYIEELPGCIAAADTEEEVKSLIAEAAIMHLNELRTDFFETVEFAPEYEFARWRLVAPNPDTSAVSLPIPTP